MWKKDDNEISMRSKEERKYGICQKVKKLNVIQVKGMKYVDKIESKWLKYEQNREIMNINLKKRHI